MDNLGSFDPNHVSGNVFLHCSCVQLLCSFYSLRSLLTIVPQSSHGSHADDQVRCTKQEFSRSATCSPETYVHHKPSVTQSPPLNNFPSPYQEDLGQSVGHVDFGNHHTSASGTCLHSGHNAQLHGANNNVLLSGVQDACYNSTGNIWLNVGQFQLSSCRMINAEHGDGISHPHHQFTDSRTGQSPNSCSPDSLYNIRTACFTPPPQPISPVEPSLYQWQFSPAQDFGTWNTNGLLLGCHPSPTGSPLVQSDVNRHRSDSPNTDSRFNMQFRQQLRFGSDSNLRRLLSGTSQSCTVHTALGSNDDDSWSSRNSQDNSDTDSLESFGSSPYVLTSSLMSEIGPCGQMSPVKSESFRGDTPHPEFLP